VISKIRIGTRGSALALAQSRSIAQRIERNNRGAVKVELEVISTRGDAVLDRPLSALGGKGLFTAELEAALLEGRIDIAVHSLKDLPTDDPPGLALLAIPQRADPRDVLVGATLDQLGKGAVVGTGSARRKAQLLGLRPDLDVRDIRGNVETRVGKQEAGQYDAIVLAQAGLTRLAIVPRVYERFPVERFVPAVGQGALAVQGRCEDEAVLEVVRPLQDQTTFQCVLAERAFLRRFGGGCHVPACAYARVRWRRLRLIALFAPEGGQIFRVERTGSPSDAGEMGRLAAEMLLSAAEGER
jgi:hydroxymethylbilane synthase